MLTRPLPLLTRLLRAASLAPLVIAIVALMACRADEKGDKAKPKSAAPAAPQASQAPVQAPTEPPPPELQKPVDLWRDGQPAGQIDAEGAALNDHVFLDLGEGWSPILFSDGEGAEPKPHSFRPTYLSLARGQFKKEPFYDRARNDKYLELYGIMPTLSVLRARLHWAEKLTCTDQLDLTAINNFNGVVAYEGQEQAAITRTRYLVAKKHVERLLQEQGVTDPAQIDLTQLKDKDKSQVKYYLRQHDDYEAIRAAQDRLECEGYFKGKGRWLKGAFDWATHEALAEFERRHRVYSWGAMGPDTLEALRMDTRRVEHETVVRVLTERAMHAFGAIEDGSAVRNDKPIEFTGADGKLHPVPNLEEAMRKAVIKAFGLHDPASTAAFLDGLKLDDPEGHLYVAIPGPPRPEYHSSNMELSVVIDRGDVWYEFPFDELGQERSQPVSRRPHTTIVVNYLGQKFPIARFGTTIGGWRSELIEDVVFWKYKGSPWGEVLWDEIVSAPVWLPPNTTPPRDLLRRRERRKPGETKWEPNVHETGPSYASAYGLVAAYHREYLKRPDGSVRLGGDEGIRSHGSVDYMSIMRRHSHGCHRLHNHIAVRLFSFVVAHRPHQRQGHQPTNFKMALEYEDEKHLIHIKQGGYVFKLDTPIFVTVEEGRIRGNVKKPILTAVPKFNAECQAYVMPDGRPVIPRPDGTLIPSMAPPCPAGAVRAPPPPAFDDSSPLNSPLGQVPAGELPAAELGAGETLGAASP